MHWRMVLTRLISIVRFLPKQNLAFRGCNVKIYEESNEKFMVMVKMIVEWDLVMKDHLEKKGTSSLS